MVEALLNSRAMRLVISSEFAKKQRFKLMKIEKPINMRNMNGSFNKERLIEHMVEVNIYYQRHRERTKIDMIGRQRNMISEMLWLVCYNSEIYWKTREVKMMKYLKKCGK